MSALSTSIQLPVEYEPRLIEEALLRAICGDPRESDFRRERDRIYECEDPEHRDAGFEALHARWFSSLGLDAPLAQALEEQPSLARDTRLCRVVNARARLKEGADLYVHADESATEERLRRAILIRLIPTTFLDGRAMLDLLRHELVHVTDMLDPAFGYEPALPRSGDDPSLDTLIRNRYRVLWNATVDGRLQRRRWAKAGVRARRLADFVDTFPISVADAERAFSHWFDTPDHRHEELVAFAQNPGVGSGQCPLCRAPAFGLRPDSTKLEPGVVEAIRKDYAQWQPETGLCQQCADLYASRT